MESEESGKAARRSDADDDPFALSNIAARNGNALGIVLSERYRDGSDGPVVVEDPDRAARRRRPWRRNRPGLLLFAATAVRLEAQRLGWNFQYWRGFAH